MCHAVRVVRSTNTGYLRASKYFSVPRANSGEVPTSPSPEKLVNVHLGRKTVIPSELENKLVEYCIIMDQLGNYCHYEGPVLEFHNWELHISSVHIYEIGLLIHKDAVH